MQFTQLSGLGGGKDSTKTPIESKPGNMTKLNLLPQQDKMQTMRDSIDNDNDSDFGDATPLGKKFREAPKGNAGLGAFYSPQRQNKDD